MTIYQVIDGDYVPVKVEIKKGKKFAKVPEDWEEEIVAVYPAKVLYAVVGGRSIKSVKQINGDKWVELPDEFKEDHAKLVRVKKFVGGY